MIINIARSNIYGDYFYIGKIIKDHLCSFISNNTKLTQKAYLTTNLIRNRNILNNISLIDEISSIDKSNIINIYTNNIKYLELTKFTISNINGLTKIYQNSNKDGFIFWAKKLPNIYPLYMVLWPTMIPFFKDIIKELDKFYYIEYYNFKKIKNINKLVYNLYNGDIKCDKSKLIYKINRFKKYPNIYGFIKFYVRNPFFNSLKISKTAIKIKKNIRNKYNKKIKDYFYDIIVHISDNGKHGKNMEYAFHNIK